MRPMQIAFTGEQAASLLDVLHEMVDGDMIVMTARDDGAVIVDGTMARVRIDPNGGTEEL